MTYEVLALKWRPKNFTDLVGQEHVQRALINALNQSRLHHAYLFTGTRGVGKTTLARILAKCFNCEQGVNANPCGQCQACIGIDTGRFVDLIEVDAASRTKVEDTRELLNNVPYAPTQGRFKVYLIDEVHMLSGHSFNALLKTLEEPPPHIKFLLATTDPQKLPMTILSRCLQFNLKNLPVELISKQLAFVLNQENIEFELGALDLLARAAEGSMRDALSLLDQAIGFSGTKVTREAVAAMLGTIEHTYVVDILTALSARDGRKIINISEQLAENGANFPSALEELLGDLHQLAIKQAIPDYNLDPTLASFLPELSAEDLQLYYQIGLLGRRDLPLAPTAKIGFEMTLLRMLAFKPLPPLEIKPAFDITSTSAISKPQDKEVSSKTVSACENEIPSQPRNTPANHWSDILSKLNLNSMALALANHCSLHSFVNNHMELLLDSSQAPLLTAALQQRIQQALSSYYNNNISLKITVAQNEVESPAREQARITDTAKRQATFSIENDSNVQALLESFNGRLDTQSIQPRITVEE